MSHRPPALLFGVPIADLTMAETLDVIAEYVRLGRQQRTTHQVSTVNIDFLTNALDEPALMDILQRSELCIADGMPLVWLATLLDMQLRERVAGADLVPELFDRSQREGWRIHVLGSSPAVAARSRDLISERWPAADVTIDPGPMIPDPRDVDPSCIDSIVEVDPDILCVALGNPKQEHFIHHHREQLGVPVMIGVGGSLDMLVGERKRAPGWMQRTGLEWVARALQEPRRLGARYAHDLRVMAPAAGRAWWAHRRTRDDGGIDLHAGDPVAISIGVASPFSGDDYVELASRIAEGAQVELDASEATVVADRTAAIVAGLVGLARRSGASVSWKVPPSPAVLAELRRLGVAPHLWGLPATSAPQ